MSLQYGLRPKSHPRNSAARSDVYSCIGGFPDT